jgi:hypothetical protein
MIQEHLLKEKMTVTATHTTIDLLIRTLLNKKESLRCSEQSIYLWVKVKNLR